MRASTYINRNSTTKFMSLIIRFHNGNGARSVVHHIVANTAHKHPAKRNKLKTRLISLYYCMHAINYVYYTTTVIDFSSLIEI